jgi:hypothetical protein
MNDQTTKRWWKAEWGKAFFVGLIVSLLNVFLFKTQPSWTNWIQSGIGVAFGLVIYDFAFVRQATFRQRLYRIELVTACLAGFFAAVFSRAFH